MYVYSSRPADSPKPFFSPTLLFLKFFPVKIFYCLFEKNFMVKAFFFGKRIFLLENFFIFFGEIFIGKIFLLETALRTELPFLRNFS